MRSLLFSDRFCGTTMDIKDGSNRLAKAPHATTRNGYTFVWERKFLSETGQKIRSFPAENIQKLSCCMSKYIFCRSRCFLTNRGLVTLTC